jgi:hypothetical protein
MSSWVYNIGIHLELFTLEYPIWVIVPMFNKLNKTCFFILKKFVKCGRDGNSLNSLLSLPVVFEDNFWNSEARFHEF